MAKRTYSIRRGFEYQDTFCAIKLMRAMKDGLWDARFMIESNEVEYIDDFVFQSPGASPVGHQIKFQVTQGSYHTFDTFLTRRTSKSQSLLEKLYAGWNDCQDNSETGCELEFISASHAEPGAGKLADAILTDTFKFRDDFFTKFKKPRQSWLDHLGISEPQLKQFLSCATWRFAHGSVSDLRATLEDVMETTRLPQGDDAISAVLQTIAHYALQIDTTSTVKHFAKSLWNRPILRDAIEQLLDPADIPSTSVCRARRVKIACITLDSIPAFACRDYVCLEEPLSIDEYQKGISGNRFQETFDSLRSSLLQEYLSWQKTRLASVLRDLEEAKPDIIVFARFSIPAELASFVSDWCCERDINVVLGGHVQPDATGIESHYSQSLSLLPPLQLSSEEDGGFIIDCIVRSGRAGRYCTSIAGSPYKRQETVVRQTTLTKVLCSSGWLNILLIPSVDVLRRYASSDEASPELTIVSCNIHESQIYDLLKATPKLHNTPLVVCSAKDSQPKLEVLSRTDSPSNGKATDWEGISIGTFSFDRSSESSWSSKIYEVNHVPIVYAPDRIVAEDSKILGLINSIADAKQRLTQNEDVVTIECPDPHSFFVARARRTNEFIRSILTHKTAQEIGELSETLGFIEASLTKRTSNAEICSIVATAQSHAPKARRRPALVDRTTERTELSRFLDGSSSKRLFFLHGPSGVGKRSLVTDIKRTHPRRQTWLHFQCLEDATVAEILAQFLTVLGKPIHAVPELDASLYSLVAESIKSSSYTHFVFENAHHFPMRANESEHSELMAFFATITSSDLGKPILLISDRKAALEFSGKHHLGQLFLQGLSTNDTVHLLQELLSDITFSHDPPDTDDLTSIAKSIHGVPLLAEIAASILENTPVDELVGSLHKHDRVRHFILEMLLGQVTPSPVQDRFLMLAATMRTPVPISAFIPIAGANSRRIAEELLSRFLLTESNSLYELHPLLADYYRGLIPDDNVKKKLHKTAFKYYDNLQSIRTLTIEEKGERVFHAFRSGQYLRLDDLRLFTGPIRRALFDGLNSRDWGEVLRSAKQILEIFPSDALGRTAMAVALDATGKDSDPYFDSVSELDYENLWVGLELAKSKIRRHDFQKADLILSELRQLFASNLKVEVTSAQLDQARGRHDQAIEKCDAVLRHPDCREGHAFAAGLILLSLKRLDLLVNYVVKKLRGKPKKPGLVRLYAFGQVITDIAPTDGLSTLSNLWHSSPFDAFVTRDFALALAHTKDYSKAERVLEKGIKNKRWVRGGIASIHEAYANYWELRRDYKRAHDHYRLLLNLRPYDTHVYRLFAASLIAGAKAAKSDNQVSVEQACVDEAKRVLKSLLEIAPEDETAVTQLHRVSSYNY